MTGTVLKLLRDGEAEMCMPGDNVEMEVELHNADRHGGGPAVRHSRRRPTVGSGVVTKILE